MRLRRLLKTAPPIAGESLRGLVANACARNHIPNTWGMLQHFGLRHRNRVDVSESQDIDTAALATALSIDESEVMVRRYPGVGRSHRNFYGMQIHAGRIEDRIRRFSPAAIAAGYDHHPAVHELRDLPFSLIGWDMLQETCPCEFGGARQGWTRVNGTSRCDRCGGWLGRLDPGLVPQHLQSRLSLLAGIVNPDHEARQPVLTRLPDAIKAANRSLLFDVAVSLGACADKAKFAGACAQMEQTYGLALACDALLEWPHGLTRFRRASLLPENKWELVRRNYLLLDRCCEEDLPLDDGQSTTCDSPAGKATYVPSGRCGRIEGKFISAMAAARLGLVDETALKQAWDDGLLTAHKWVHGDSLVRAFDPEEVIALAPRLRRTKAQTRVAHLLGMSVFGVEQLEALGLFQPQHPSLEQSQWDVHQAEFRLLADRVATAAENILLDPVPLQEAVRHISGRPKPWGPIIEALLTGAIHYTYADSEKSLVGRIAIPRQSLAAVTNLSFNREQYPHGTFAEQWAQKDALECLNGDENAPWLLDQLASSGSRPKRFMAADVEALAIIYITTADLASRAGMSVSKIYAMLRDAGISHIAKGLWDRSAAERVILH